MADCRVTCIEKNKYGRITFIGNLAAGWKWSEADVIRTIENGTNTFYVIDPYNGKRADIGIVRGNHLPYLRTHADGDWNDNLESLDQCSI